MEIFVSEKGKFVPREKNAGSKVIKKCVIGIEQWKKIMMAIETFVETSRKAY